MNDDRSVIRSRLEQDCENEVRYLNDAKVQLKLTQNEVEARFERVDEYKRIIKLCYGGLDKPSNK